MTPTIFLRYSALPRLSLMGRAAALAAAAALASAASSIFEPMSAAAASGTRMAVGATAPIATQSKTPLVVMAAATSSITEASPYIVRTSTTLPQSAVAMADWAPANGIKKVVTLVTDYGPGIDAEKYFKERYATTLV